MLGARANVECYTAVAGTKIENENPVVGSVSDSKIVVGTYGAPDGSASDLESRQEASATIEARKRRNIDQNNRAQIRIMRVESSRLAYESPPVWISCRPAKRHSSAPCFHHRFIWKNSRSIIVLAIILEPLRKKEAVRQETRLSLSA